jgi:hypothetical protein
VGSSILASLSEAGGDVLLRLTSKPLPPHSPSSTKRHLECTLALYLASDAPFASELSIRTSPLNLPLSALGQGSNLRASPTTGRESRLKSRLGKNRMRQPLPSTHNSKIPPSPEPLPYPISRFNESKCTRMNTAPKLRQVATALFLGLWFTCIPGLADTHNDAYPLRNSPPCACGCASNENGRTHTLSCDLGQCQSRVPDLYCKPNQKSLGSSDHLPQSRPVYSRKSNRTQRAQR